MDHNNATDKFELTRGMKIALGVSIAFHLTVMIAGTIGLPFITKPPRLNDSAIAVEIVDVADITTTNKKPVQAKPKPPEEKKEPPKTVKKVEAPPKVEAKEPPKMKPIKKPEPKKDTVKPKPKVPPPPSEKLDKPKEPKPKKEEPKEEATTQEDDFASLMKNLQDGEEESEGEGEADPDYSPDAPISQTMTANELSSLTNQLVGCWQIPIGAKDVNNMVVTLHIWPNTDRTVQKVEIQDRLRMSTDQAFRALAESARTAVLSPYCSPLDIPMDKIDVWKGKYISIDFDPSHVT